MKPLTQSAVSPSLPRHLTQFVGRTAELAEIRQRLGDPACRLLTLVGPGGIGKTRLAIAAASALTSDFPDGVAFVELHDVPTADAMLRAIADALHCPLSGQHDALAQLAHFLANRNLLLILDSVEALASAADRVAQLLAATTGVKFLVTSRAMLNLQHEWLYPVGELPVPVGDLPSDWQESEAVRLFVERARQVRWDFNPQAEAAAIVRICQLVGGMPLALELAAAWLKLLSCTDVVAELQDGLDILHTTQRDVPPRHRSIQSVFDQTWQQLAEAERTTLMQLGVFQGGFARVAAESVAGATLKILAVLVEKSLLRWDPLTRRYTLHELLRQFALGYLARSSDDLQATHARHCAYYAAFLQTCSQELMTDTQSAVVEKIALELGNIRSAWQWAVDQGDVAALGKLAPSLVDFYQTRGRYREGADLLAAAVQMLRHRYPGEDSPVLALLLTYLGTLDIRLGRIEEARSLLWEAQAAYRRLQLAPVAGYNTDPTFSLGIIALIYGDYGEAVRLGEAARRTACAHDHPRNLQLAHYLLACATQGLADYATAQTHAQTALELARQTNSQWFMAYCLNEIGNVALALGEYGTAQEHFAQSYAIRQAFNDPEGMAVALLRLGETALAQGDASAARDLCEQSQALYRQTGDKGGLAMSLNWLGLAAVSEGDYAAARHHFASALTLALEIRYHPCLLAACMGIGRLLLEVGEHEPALDLLAYVYDHPHSARLLRDQIQALFTGSRANLASALTARRATPHTPDALDEVARDLLATLTRPSAHTFPARRPDPAAEALLESLSAREVELLQLVAAGLKNREIADQLVISLNTVKAHINNIYGKLGVNSRVQAVTRARELGLV